MFKGNNTTVSVRSILKKILLFIAVFIIPCSIQALCLSKNIIIGGFPTILLFCPFVILFNRLSKKLNASENSQPDEIVDENHLSDNIHNQDDLSAEDEDAVVLHNCDTEKEIDNDALSEVETSAANLESPVEEITKVCCDAEDSDTNNFNIKKEREAASEDIKYSLSKRGEDIAPVKGWAIYGKDVLVKNRKTGDDIAPISEVEENNNINNYDAQEEEKENPDESHISENDSDNMLETVVADSTPAPQKKKSFNIKKAFVVIPSILLCISLVFNVVMAVNLQQKKERIRDLNQELSDCRYWLDTWEEDTLDYYAEAAKAEFLDEHIVFVIDGYENYYYTYDAMMEVVSDQWEYSFWAYNIEQAQSLGYWPSPLN